MTSLGHEKVSQVFAGRPDLIEGIKQAADTPERVILFNSIANYVFDEFLSGEPSAKRRRIEVQGQNGSTTATNTTTNTTATITTADHGKTVPPGRAAPAFKVGQSASPVPANDSILINLANAAAKEVVLLEIKEISVSIPQRKKYDLVFTKNYLYTKQVGTDAPVQGMVYEWSKIEYVFYAPVPEKQQLMYNYILFPHNTALASTKAWGLVDFEPLLFTVPCSAPKAGVVAGYAAETAAQVSDSYTSLMSWAIQSQLQSVGNSAVSIVSTDPRVFYSNAKQPYRPGEKAVHIKAFRGSKDGYLFFLPNGILWGYKKPLLFIPLERIVAVSYTNVLQRTFNILVEVDLSHAPAQDGQQQQKTGPQVAGNDTGPKSEEIEFGMIDQDDYQVIDETYVRRHGLNNRSMAAGRRAKMQLRENTRGAGAAAAGAGATNGAVQYPGGEDEEMAELERAEQIIEEDEEDEEEEDYDPGSEGESEGEVSTSEEEDEDGEEGEEGDESDEAEGYDEEGAEEEGYAEDHE